MLSHTNKSNTNNYLENALKKWSQVTVFRLLSFKRLKHCLAACWQDDNEVNIFMYGTYNVGGK